MPARTNSRKKTAKKKPMRGKTMKASAKKRMAAKEPRIKIVGRVIHFYDRIQVAIVELAAPLHIGDMVKIKHHGQEFVQNVDSLQIEHLAVEQAKKKQVVGMKVLMPVREGALVLPA